MQFSENHITNYGTSFKAKIMLLSLKWQIFPLWSKFVSFIEFLDNKQNFSKTRFATFWHIWQNVPMQNINKVHLIDLQKLSLRRMDRRVDGRTGLILQDPFREDGSLIMFFGNSRIKCS